LSKYQHSREYLATGLGSLKVLEGGLAPALYQGRLNLESKGIP
jgi:hypothetical protein